MHTSQKPAIPLIASPTGRRNNRSTTWVSSRRRRIAVRKWTATVCRVSSVMLGRKIAWKTTRTGLEKPVAVYVISGKSRGMPPAQSSRRTRSPVVGQRLITNHATSSMMASAAKLLGRRHGENNRIFCGTAQEYYQTTAGQDLASRLGTQIMKFLKECRRKLLVR